MEKFINFLKKNWLFVTTLSISVVINLLLNNKNQKLKGEIRSCEKVNKELIRETEHQARIIGKQQEIINKNY